MEVQEQNNHDNNGAWYEEQQIQIKKTLHRLSDEADTFRCHMGRCEEFVG